jgi:hypothetical protein
MATLTTRHQHHSFLLVPSLKTSFYPDFARGAIDGKRLPCAHPARGLWHIHYGGQTVFARHYCPMRQWPTHIDDQPSGDEKQRPPCRISDWGDEDFSRL